MNGIGFPVPFFIGSSVCAFLIRETTMRYWLMKSEPDEASIDHLAHAPKKTLPWTGVRNYQARNFMRDQMQISDGVLFYHSSCPEPGIAGIAKVCSTAYPDLTQFDSKSPYYDAKSTQETPRWMLVDVEYVKKTPLISLAALREPAALGGHAGARARQSTVDHAGYGCAVALYYRASRLAQELTNRRQRPKGGRTYAMCPGVLR